MTFIDACPVGCAAPLERTDVVLPEGPLRRCPACGQLVSACTAERYRESMQEFDDDRGTLPSSPPDERRGRTLAERRLARIARILARQPRDIALLDVGCSSGAFLRIAASLGYRCEGVEPAPRAARTAARAGLKVFQGVLEDARYPDASFDAITLFEVIEHLREPVSLLKECRRVLKPGGVLLVGTGNAASWTATSQGAEWEYLHIARHGGHVSFFNPGSLRLAAERSGFAVHDLETNAVRLVAKDGRPRPLYVAAKLAGEALHGPARWFRKGHDMLAFLR
ncbi:MAG TPA: class I SAM-dependent methyltransferase [Anaeromyxobacter sp.]|nr:class I SAM-dependent methyltransferase [Anaeromyxobacter sp.]